MSIRMKAFLGVAATTLTFAGCMDSGATSDPATIQSNLEKDNGGMDTADEAPQFGAEDEFAAASISTDTAVSDPIAQDPTVLQLNQRTDIARYRVDMLWGQLPPDRTNPDVHDWSGSITVSRGALIVRRTVGFELGDHLVPRTSPDTVAFHSVTRPFADGLALTVLDPNPDPSVPLTLTYTPDDGSAPIVFAAADLANGPVSVDVGANGDRMVAIALRDHDACEHGFMRGRWHALRAGLGGFLGVVSDADGNPIGHVRGIWGVRKNGERVFFGKYINADGLFRGILAGHYRDGAFVGRWLTRAGEFGRTQGLYREDIPGPETGGHFIGRWAETSCAQNLPPDQP